jgi:murein DD-endopeptidase MepM/ murein hydrolase activator NlpD
LVIMKNRFTTLHLVCVLCAFLLFPKLAQSQSSVVIRIEPSPDRLWIVVTNLNGQIDLYDTDGQFVYRFRDSGDNVLAISWKADSQFFVTGDFNGLIQIWDVNNRRLERTLPKPLGFEAIGTINWNMQEEKIFAVAQLSGIVIWNSETGELVGNTHIPGVTDAQWSGREIIAVRSGKIFILDSLGIIKREISTTYYTLIVSINPINNRIALLDVSGRAVAFFNLDTGTQLSYVEIQEVNTNYIQWSSDGTKFAIWSQNGTLTIWNYPSSTLLLTITSPSQFIPFYWKDNQTIQYYNNSTGGFSSSNVLTPTATPTPTLTPRPTLTPTVTLTPRPTLTPTQTLTPTPTPVRNVLPEAQLLHQRAEQFGLSEVFDRFPVEIPDQYRFYQGYGPTGFAASVNPYVRTQGVHPGMDYFNDDGGTPISNVLSLCDGIIIGARAQNPGGSAGGGSGIAVRCFAPENGDPDRDGNINLSNIVITYNHLYARFSEYRASNINPFVFVSKGTIIGQTNNTLPPEINHLHLEVFIRGQNGQSSLPYGYFDGIGAIRINPLLMFERSLAEQHLGLLGDDSSFPYYPYYVNLSGIRVDLNLESRFRNVGLGINDLSATTLESDLSITSSSFWSIQTPTPPGIIEWPTNVIGQQPITTLLSSVGQNNLTLVSHLERFYQSGSNYYDSEQTLNCSASGITVGMETTPGTIITNVICN